MVPEIRFSFPLVTTCNCNLFVLRRLAGKLDFEIGLDGRRRRRGLRQPRAHRDHGKFRAARDLDHVQIAVAVPGIERLYRHGDQKVALSLVANAFASRGMADAFGLMQRMRNVISQRALLQNPLAGPRRKAWEAQAE